LAWN